MLGKKLEFSKSLLCTYYVPNAMWLPVGRCKRLPSLQILLVYLGILDGYLKVSCPQCLNKQQYKASHD